MLLVFATLRRYVYSATPLLFASLPPLLRAVPPRHNEHVRSFKRATPADDCRCHAAMAYFATFRCF